MSVLSLSGATTTAEPAGRDWTFDEWSAGFDIHLGVYQIIGEAAAIAVGFHRK